MNITKNLFLLFLSLQLASCGNKNLVDTAEVTTNSESSTQEEEQLPWRYQLYREYSKNEVLVIYDGKNQAVAEQFDRMGKNLLSSLTDEQKGQYKLSFLKANEVTTADRKNKILYLIGNFKDEQLIEELESRIPFQIDDTAFSFNANKYDSAKTVLAIHNYPNPQHLSLPITLITGNDEQAIMDVFARNLSVGINFLWNTFDFIIYNDTVKETVGSFDGQWKFQDDQVFQFGSMSQPVVSTEKFEIYSQNQEFSLENLNALGQSLEQSASSIQQFVGIEKKLPKINYYIYASAESKALQQNNSTQAHLDFSSNSVHTIINDKYADNYIEKENQLILRHLLGEPTTPILETGLAITFTDKWQREGYEYWTAQLSASGNAMTIAALMDNESLQFESPLIRACMAASFVDFLITRDGKSDFINNYTTRKFSKSEKENLEADWQAYHNSLIAKYPKRKREKEKALNLKGFNFAHEGYRIFNGYLSKLATQSIEKQAVLGCNAIAIVPYSYMRDDKKPAPFPITNRPGSENDQGVIHSAYEAKIRGMKTMLKPQIWLNGSWPGEIEMQSTEDWKSFFYHYHKWIRHYALLAEIHEIDLLCVGVEFAKATLAHEDQWRAIFDSVRGLYQGQMTYAANWGDEFEKVQFWDALDFIGLNCYYPLSNNSEASKAELSSNFEKVKTKIEKVHNKFQKPVVFTEIGFRSIDAPWIHPHAEGNDSYNETHQDRCYQVVMEGVENEDWYGGILWWKFPSYLRYGGTKNTSYTPNNKLAEKTIRQWFSRDNIN